MRQDLQIQEVEFGRRLQMLRFEEWHIRVNLKDQVIGSTLHTIVTIIAYGTILVSLTAFRRDEDYTVGTSCSIDSSGSRILQDIKSLDVIWIQVVQIFNG
jgi:hypothetical protein